ncbi:MAG: peptidylprolyl isomerase [Gemmatimonadota bacterium]|nr:peptidylprolyl isomerase [Gemmatimonadota bacterium]
MMQAFRNTAKPIIVILTVAFVGWLVFDLSGLSGGGGLLTQTAVGRIEGQSVEVRAFQEAVQAAIENEQRSTGNSLGIEGVARVRDQVWEQFVTAALLEREYQRRGIRTSSAEIADAIRNIPLPEMMQNPDMLSDGQFDAVKYQRWLGSAVGQQYIPLLENRYRDEILRSKLFRSLVADVSVSDPALWERYRDEHETARIGLLRLDPATSVPESEITVSAGEVDAWYRENRQKFEQPRRVWMSFVSLPRLPIASDSLAALARAVAVREELVNGAPFAEVASRESSDQVSAAQGGELGEWTRGQFDPAFQAAADLLPLNDISEPVLSGFGYHIIQLTSKGGDTFNGRHILIPIEVSGDHRDQLDAQADSLETLGADRLDGVALDTVARALDLTIGQTGRVIEGQQVLAGGEVAPDAGVWAFQAQLGETSPVIESESAYFVFRVDSTGAAGVPPLERIRTEVEAAVRGGKRTTAAAALATEIRREAEAGTPLAQVAARRGLEYTEPEAFTRLAPLVETAELNGAAFGTPPGEVSAVIATEQGVWVVQALTRVPADSAQFAAELPTLRTRELQSLRQVRVREFMLALRQGAKITDRRAELYQTDAQAEAQAAATSTTGPIPF